MPNQLGPDSVSPQDWPRQQVSRSHASLLMNEAHIEKEISNRTIHKILQREFMSETSAGIFAVRWGNLFRRWKTAPAARTPHVAITMIPSIKSILR